MSDNATQESIPGDEESSGSDSAPHGSCRPFLKWVGGKSQLLPELFRRLPSAWSRYYEPFIGGGALFFHLQPAVATIGDSNPELINAYEVVRDNLAELIESLKTHRYEKQYYYTVRDVDRSAEFQHWTKVQRAARLIYLNKTCFNGLYRVNSKGQFNTPFGRYSDPTIVNEKVLAACSKALLDVTITQAPFTAIEETITTEDFVYFDPPYVPLSTTSSFTSYSKDSFNEQLQQELFELCERLDKKGVRFMLSNSSAPWVVERYSRFTLERVSASRAVNAKSSGRGKIDEVLVTNY